MARTSIFHIGPAWLLAWAVVSAPAPAPAIVIDGSIDDWTEIAALPVDSMDADVDSPLGRIRFMKVAVDPDFIYVLVGFETARPFDPAARQNRLRNGVWDDFSYVEIDIDEDRHWDFKAKMTTGKRFGRNNLMILRSNSPGSPGIVYLHPEGHKDYYPLGPRAFFLLGARAVELRIPREPLGLESGRIFLRASVRYRDKIQGSGKWVDGYFPGSEYWIGLDLAEPEIDELLLHESRSPNRLLEPTLRRGQVEVQTRYSESQRLMSTYVYPRPVAPTVLQQLARIRARAAGIQFEKPEDPTRALVIIGPSGEITDLTPRRQPTPTLIGDPIAPVTGVRALPTPLPTPPPTPGPLNAPSSASAPGRAPARTVETPAPIPTPLP